MALRSPLTVHVAGLGAERHVDVTGLEFTRTVDGGYDSATFTLPEWVDAKDLALGPVSRVMVDDGRTTRRLFEGFLDIAGKTVDSNGHTWRVGASGAKSVLSDRSKQYVAISTDLTSWTRGACTKPEMTAGPDKVPDSDDDGLVMSIPRGIAVTNEYRATARFGLLAESGQKVGGFAYDAIAGVSDTNWKTEGVVSGGASEETARTNSFSTAATGLLTRVCSTHFATDQTVLRVRGRKNAGGATNIADDDHWTAATSVRVTAQRVDQDGAAITGAAYAVEYVLAHEVVIDALWWFTNQIDIAGASIDTTFTYEIDQLAYPDPVRLPDILDDLALLEPDMIREVLGSNLAGLHRFVLRRWPTDVRYEIDVGIEGNSWSSPGGEATFANSLAVSYTDKRGNTKTVTVTSDNEFLDQWTRVRDAEVIELGSEIGTLAAATQVANAVLEQMSAVPFAGTVTVGNPVRDLYLGRDVLPQEIEPGYLVSLRDIDVPPMRLTEMTYRDSDQSAELALGTPMYTADQLFAGILPRRLRRGGRDWQTL